MRKKQAKLKQQRDDSHRGAKQTEIQGKKDSDSDEEEEPQQVEMHTTENEEWLEYLAKPHKEVRTSMPVQLDNAYHEFKRLLKDTDVIKISWHLESNLLSDVLFSRAK